MKPMLFTVALALFFVSASLDQDKIEKYCQVNFTLKGFSGTRYNVKFSGGEADSLFSFKDTAVLSELVRVEQYATIPDVLNYMSSLGWKPVSFLSSHEVIIRAICFKKEFDPSELNGY